MTKCLRPFEANTAYNTQSKQLFSLRPTTPVRGQCSSGGIKVDKVEKAGNMSARCRSACRRVLARSCAPRANHRGSLPRPSRPSDHPRPPALATLDMFDPLSSTFGEEPQPPWPTTPHMPNTPIPNLPRPSSRPSSRPQTPDKGGIYGRQPQIYGQPEPGLISPTANAASNGTKYERAEPYLKVRITGLDRNRRDILVKFDAQVRISM